MNRKCLIVVGVFLLASAGPDLLACGDKFLVVSRGTRFQRAGVAREPAKILVYANPATSLPTTLAKARADETLRKAGYRPTSVADAGALDRALRQDAWALVVTDLADGAAVRGRLQGANRTAMVVPVLSNATGTDVALAKKEYQRIIKGPVKSQAFLEAIDEALELRAKLLKTKASA